MRRTMLLALSLFILVSYLILIDPYTNNTLLSDIPYGIQLVFIVKTFALLFVLNTMMNLFTDQTLDKTYGYDESEIAKEAMKTPEGAGYLMLSRSLRYVAIALLIIAVLYFTKDSDTIYVK